MNPQHWLDQHTYILPVVIPVFFVSLWLLITASISFFGGWRSLAATFQTGTPFQGPTWRMQSAQMRCLTNYNGALTFGANPQGLYVAIMFMFRFMHPPLFIPWSEISVRRTSGWIFKYSVLTLGREQAVTMRIQQRLADKLREAAQGHWPVEEI